MANDVPEANEELLDVFSIIAAANAWNSSSTVSQLAVCAIVGPVNDNYTAGQGLAMKPPKLPVSEGKGKMKAEDYVALSSDDDMLVSIGDSDFSGKGSLSVSDDSAEEEKKKMKIQDSISSVDVVAEALPKYDMVALMKFLSPDFLKKSAIGFSWEQLAEGFWVFWSKYEDEIKEAKKQERNLPRAELEALTNGDTTFEVSIQAPILSPPADLFTIKYSLSKPMPYLPEFAARLNELREKLKKELA